MWTAQSVQRLAKGWTVRGSNRGGSEIFRTCPDRPWGPPSLLYNGYRAFPGGKERPGRDNDPSPLLVPWSWKGRAIPLLPLWPGRPVQSLNACTRVTFTFTFTFYYVAEDGWYWTWNAFLNSLPLHSRMELLYSYNAHEGGLHEIKRLCTTTLYKRWLKQLQTQMDYCGNFSLQHEWSLTWILECMIVQNQLASHGHHEPQRG